MTFRESDLLLFYVNLLQRFKYRILYKNIVRGKRKMKLKIVSLSICFLLIIPAMTLSSANDPEAELDIQIYGGFPLPFLISNAGGTIVNIGDTTAYNISYILSIVGGVSSNINFTYEGFEEYLEPVKTSGKALGITTSTAKGFGFVTITLSASATNADNVTVRARGFQIGDFTWIPLSWVIPRILRNFVPWLEY